MGKCSWELLRESIFCFSTDTKITTICLFIHFALNEPLGPLLSPHFDVEWKPDRHIYIYMYKYSISVFLYYFWGGFFIILVLVLFFSFFLPFSLCLFSSPIGWITSSLENCPLLFVHSISLSLYHRVDTSLFAGRKVTCLFCCICALAIQYRVCLKWSVFRCRLNQINPFAQWPLKQKLILPKYFSSPVQCEEVRITCSTSSPTATGRPVDR